MATGGPGSKLAIADGDSFWTQLEFEHTGKGEKVYVFYKIKVSDTYITSISGYVDVPYHSTWTKVSIPTNPAVFDCKGLAKGSTIDGDVVLVRPEGTITSFCGDALMVTGEKISFFGAGFSAGVTQWSMYWRRGNTSWKMPGWPGVGYQCVIGPLPLGEIFQVNVYEYKAPTGEVIDHGTYNVSVMTVGPYTWNIWTGGLE